ncbi:MAG TPA: PaaX family transcriptional regulator C-terminal domain-containing protein [Pseudomonadales bacterium]|nr:PaaX family transcriptional regulator C-terminal domain-containing protein [Pseudomonadales bacterium]
MKANAKHLILELLLAAEQGALSVREAITACQLFGFSENNVRVVLARLSAEGMIEAAGRGRYRLGSNATELAAEVSTWRNAEQRLRTWQGDYLLVHAGTLGRTDRPALRRRERALGLLGFCELERGLYIRPNNIETGVDAVRERLYKLGLEKTAAIFQASQFDSVRERAIHALWNGPEFNTRYRQTRQQLQHWLTQVPTLTPNNAARESFLLGSQAIRQVLYDPLLPEPFVDAAERHQFFIAVKEFDAVGHAIWRKLLATALTRTDGDTA